MVATQGNIVMFSSALAQESSLNDIIFELCLVQPDNPRLTDALFKFSKPKKTVRKSVYWKKQALSQGLLIDHDIANMDKLSDDEYLDSFVNWHFEAQGSFEKLKRRNKQQRKREEGTNISAKSASDKRMNKLWREIEKEKHYRKQKFQNFVAQGDGIFDIPFNLNTTLKSVSGAADNITNIVNSIRDFVCKIAPIPDKLDLFKVVKNIIHLKNAYYAKSYAGFTFALHELIKNFEINLAAFSNRCLSLLKTSYDSVTDAIFSHFKAQSFEPSALFTPIGSLIVTILSFLFSKSNVPSDKLFKYLGDFGRSAVGFTKAADLFEWIKKTGIDMYNRFTLGKSSEQLRMEEEYPNLLKCYARCLILQEPEFKDTYIDTNEKLCNSIVELDNELNKYSRMAIAAKDETVARLINKNLIRIKDKVIAARSSVAYSCKRRVAPVTLYVYGQSGVGKSNLVQYLAAHVKAKYFADDNNWTVDNMVFNRVVDNEFWDGYIQGQPIVYYDDILQKVDTKSNPNPEYMEIIRCKNETPYHLHMSAVNDKKNHFFTSRFLFATSNKKVIQPESITSKAAFTRRWDMAIEVRVNPNYVKKVKVDGKDKDFIDEKKVGDGFNPDIYSIDLFDLGTGKPIQTCLSLKTFIDYFDQETEAIHSKGKKLLDSICEQVGIAKAEFSNKASEFTDRFLAQCDDDEGFEDCEYEYCCLRKCFKVPPCDVDYRLDCSCWTYCKKNCVTQNHGCKNSAFYGFSMHDDELALGFQEAREQYNYNMVTDVSDDYDILVESCQRLNDRGCGITATPSLNVEFSKNFNLMKQYLWKKKSFGARARDTLYQFGTSVGHWIHKIITNPLTTIAIGTFAATLPIFMFLKQKDCYLNDINSSPSTYSIAKPSTHSCCLCKGFEPTGKVGTIEYACEAVEHLTMTLAASPTYSPAQMIAKLCVLKTLHAKHRESCVMPAVRNIGKQYNGLLDALGTESNEIRTLGQAKKIVAESNEIRTVGTRKQLNAESNETRTTGVAKKLVSEDISANNVVVEYSGEKFKAQGISDLSQFEMKQAVTYKNMVEISFAKDEAGTEKASAKAVFVTGRVVLTVKHILKENSTTVEIRKPGNPGGNIYDLRECNVTTLTDMDGKELDLVFVTLPNETSRPNILSKFISARDIKMAENAPCDLLTLKLNRHGTIIREKYEPKPLIAVSTSYSTAQGKDIKVSRAIFYKFDTEAGDCGSLLFTRSRRVPGKILGLHVAGNSQGGLSMPVSQEMLNRNLTRHVAKEEHPRRILVDAADPDFSAQGINLVYSPGKGYDREGNCMHIGYAPQSCVPSKTRLSHSMVVGTLQEPNTKPANLRPVMVGAALVNPLVKGVKKLLNFTKPVNKTKLDMCKEDVLAVLKHNMGSLRNLSYEEAITGVEEHEFLTPINRTSSPGYPYTLDNKEPGKRKWFGYDDYIINEDVRKDVESLVENCRNNRRGTVIWTSTLKDERRPIAKVDEGKTRVFAAGPMHFTIAVRQYFLNFVEKIMENRVDNEIGVGTNPYSIDWHKTALALDRVGKKVIAGDFSGFDTSLLQDLLWTVLDIINACYGDDLEGNNIRQCLFEEICNARLLVNGEIIQCDHSQPSGNPLTVIVNSIFNMLVMRYAYLVCKETSGMPMHLLDFKRNVSMQTYGDDNCLNISDDIIEWYNQRTITDALATIGLTYTDEAKTGEVVEYRSLEDIMYLKRAFVRDEFGIYRAPLKLDVCYEMTNWIRGNRDDLKDSTLENVRAALFELSIHGKSEFNEARAKLVDAFEQQDAVVRLPTYTECVQVISQGLPWY